MWLYRGYLGMLALFYPLLRGGGAPRDVMLLPLLLLFEIDFKVLVMLL